MQQEVMEEHDVLLWWESCFLESKCFSLKKPFFTSAWSRQHPLVGRKGDIGEGFQQDG